MGAPIHERAHAAEEEQEVPPPPPPLVRRNAATFRFDARGVPQPVVLYAPMMMMTLHGQDLLPQAVLDRFDAIPYPSPPTSVRPVGIQRPPPPRALSPTWMMLD